MTSRLTSLLLGVALLAAASPARAEHAPRLSLVEPSLLNLQLAAPGSGGDGILGMIPPGDSAAEPWNLPLIAGQLLAGAAINVGSVALFSSLAQSGTASGPKAAGRKMIGWGLLQFATMPLISNTAIWFIGNLDESYEPGWMWPLAVNYAAQLVAVGVRVSVGLGGNSDNVRGLLGKYIYIDYLLHGLAIPLVVTYFSIQTRNSKSFGMGSRAPASPSPALVAEVRGTFQSVTDDRAEQARAEAAPGSVSLSLASLSF